MSYILDGTTLPNPKSFKRGFIPVSQDCKTIDGRQGRDFKIVKERFVLGFDNLTSTEITAILTIVEKNVAVTFSVNEKDLTINQTDVLVNVTSINYVTPGSIYLSEMEIELVEVE